MPITELQRNKGGFNAATGTVTLAATTAGNTVIIAAFAYGGLNFTTVPSGFTKISPTTATTQRLAVYRKAVSAGETSWTLTMGGAQPCAWQAYEFEGIDTAADPVDASSAWTTATAATASTGTSGTTTAYDALALAFLGVRDLNTDPIPTWTGHTNGFVELDDQGQAGTSSNVGLSVASKPLAAIGTVECTATHSMSPTTEVVGGWVVVLAAAGSRRDPNIVAMAGMEWGTTAGWATGNITNLIFDAVGGSPAIVSGDGLASGTYCLECSAAGAAEYVSWGPNTIGSTKPVVVWRLAFWIPSTLPGADVEICSVVLTGAGGPMTVRYRTASGKIGVQIGAGTEQLSANAVSAGTRYGLDLRLDVSTTTFAVDWQLDGVDQTQATLSGQIATNINTVNTGFVTAATATVRYDDIAVSVVPGNYPLGDIRILPLKVDPAGTVTISGTTGNFQTFTNNGTLAAWNATTARNAIDDIPPTIGGTADGIAQVTSAAADYVEMPLETYNAAGNGQALRSARVYMPGWSPSATAQAFRVDGWDGTTATTLHALADPNFDNSTTTPAWIAKMWKPATGWTQAKLDAAAIRAGFSNVAQDVGWHALLVELAVRQLPTGTLFGDLATLKADPDSAGIKTVTVTPPAGYDATLHYEDPTATDVPVTGGTSHTEVIDAPDAPTVQYIAAYPAAEPDPPA